MADAAAGALALVPSAGAEAEAALLDRFAPFYDLEYGAYDADLDLYRHFAAQAAVGPGQPTRVLELGCGSGRVLQALAAAGHDCTGIDAAPALLARARARVDAAGVGAAVRL